MSGGVIIGYEGTEQGEDALALGAVFADVLGARPIVVTVMNWPGNVLDTGDLEAALEREAERGFARARERLAAWDPDTVALANPSPANGLYAIAGEREAQAIVVGSSHRGAAGRILLGSVGRALLHGSPCAVAVAPRGYAERSERRLARIGVAYDGTKEAATALRTAVGLAERTRAHLEVLTAVEAERYGLATAASILTTAELRQFEREEKARILQEGLERIPGRLAHDGRLLEGSAARVLPEAAADLDLLAIGSRGYGPIRQTLLGSTSGAIIDAAPCAVLVVPRGVGEDPLGLGEAG